MRCVDRSIQVASDDLNDVLGGAWHWGCAGDACKMVLVDYGTHSWWGVMWWMGRPEGLVCRCNNMYYQCERVLNEMHNSPRGSPPPWSLPSSSKKPHMCLSTHCFDPWCVMCVCCLAFVLLHCLRCKGGGKVDLGVIQWSKWCVGGLVMSSMYQRYWRQEAGGESQGKDRISKWFSTYVGIQPKAWFKEFTIHSINSAK